MPAELAFEVSLCVVSMDGGMKWEVVTPHARFRLDSDVLIERVLQKEVEGRWCSCGGRVSVGEAGRGETGHVKGVQ